MDFVKKMKDWIQKNPKTMKIIGVLAFVTIITVIFVVIFSGSKKDMFDRTTNFLLENKQYSQYDSLVLVNKLNKLNLPKQFFVKNNDDIDDQMKFSSLIYDWLDKIFLVEICNSSSSLTTDQFISKIYNYNKNNNLKWNEQSLDFLTLDDSLIFIILSSLSIIDISKKNIFGSFIMLYLSTIIDQYDDGTKIITFKNFDTKFASDMNLNESDYPDKKITKDKICDLAFDKYNNNGLKDTYSKLLEVYSKFDICN